TTSAPCDLIEEAISLQCVSSLVEYANADRYVLHPPLSDIERLCIRFREYKRCTIGVHPDCRRSRAPNVERIYEGMCEESFLSLVREELACLSQIERDVKLRECFVNRTNTLRDENPGVSMPSNVKSSSYDCLIIQTYVDCLLESDYKTCKEAVKLEISMLSLLAHRNGSDCVLKTTSIKTRPDEAPRKFSKSILTDPMWLFFAHGQSIWNISLSGGSFELQKAGLQKTAVLDVDVLERRIYYADVGSNSIERLNLDGTGTYPETLQKYDVDGVEGIAVDWIGRNLYSLRRTDVLVQTLDGRYRRTLYQGVMRLPRAIAAHPQKGMIFVSDWSSTAFIASAAMDGSSFTKIIVDRVTWPNALAVDIYADKIYWADAYNDVIEVSGVDGSGRHTIISDSGTVPHVFALTVADDSLYWSDWTYRGLLKADKLTGDNVTVVAQTALLPYGLKVFHLSLQPQFPSLCNTLGCEQLCLLGPERTAKCGCGEGYELHANGRNCTSNCDSKHIECGGSEAKCISMLYVCDGISHCNNHADEMKCPDFLWSDGIAVLRKLKCLAPRICLPGQFQCHDNKKCVAPGGLCDDVEDCFDSSDEKFCPPGFRTSTRSSHVN
ncbi:hypothetical protein Angca_006416, partial [Angiostrongylus cantonensis]